MIDHSLSRPGIEPLESRIAPAALLPTIKQAELAYDANPNGDRHFVKAQHGEPILISAGQVLSTSQAARDGTYLLFVEKGSAMVFLTDLNNNNEVDFNEITGIAAGDGLRFVSFVDIHGDIVTNYDADKTLSDSSISSIGEEFTKGDGLLLNNSRIEAITLRSLTINDLTDQNSDGFVDVTDVGLRLALSSYSIHGQVLAGKGFGVVGDLTSGLLVDVSGNADQLAKFNGQGLTYYIPSKPTIGAIRTGTAASGEYFSFGISRADNIQGNLNSFAVTKSTPGGDIYNIRSAAKAAFNVSGFYAGDGGIGARGGNIDTVTLSNDNASGYQVIAGDGGSGSTGGQGGSILGFTDLGSVTGQVLIDVGNGGSGTTGGGGNGGTLGLGTIPTATPGVPVVTPLTNINVNAGFTIALGDGGSGFTSGGNGASLTKAVVTTPEGAVEFGRAVVSTTRDPLHNPVDGKIIRDPNRPGIIGRTLPVDFDQDGFTDVVFTTSSPEQLIVQFGDGLGGFRLNPLTNRPDRIYLDGPIAGEALAVGDFNGDGHQDIAVGSSDVGNYAGITVFLGKWEDANANGLTDAEDVNSNDKDDFQGFYTGRTSVLPSLSSGDAAGSPILDSSYRYSRSANAINDLVVGDFDGDGFTEIAVVATHISGAGGQNQVVMVLTADQELEADGKVRQTGQFYADVGTRGTSVPSVGANPFVPFRSLGSSNDARIEATALTSAPSAFSSVGNVATYDVVVGTVVEGGITNSVTILDFSFDSPYGPTVSSVTFGSVDTNRELTKQASAGAFIRDFTVVDFNQDGNADFVAVTEQPSGFLVAAQGDGLGNGIVVTKNPFTSDNAGFFLGPQGYGIGTEQVSLRPTELLGYGTLFPIPGLPAPPGQPPNPRLDYVVDAFDTTDPGKMDDVAVLNYSTRRLSPGPASNYTITEFSIWDFTLASAGRLVVDNPGVDFSFDLANGTGTPSGADSTVVAFDTFVPVTAAPDGIADLSSINYATANPTKAATTRHVLESWGYHRPSFGQNLTFTPLAEHFIDITAGDGGNGVIGRGGAGGFLGGGLTQLNLVNPQGIPSPTLFGAFDITLPANVAFDGKVRLAGGDGGNGFTSGGVGGGVLGASVHFAAGTVTLHTETTLTGGKGGFGISGTGGAGGSLVANSLERGILLTAGEGGRGKIGGDGGSIIGHGLQSFPDNREPFQIMSSGNGGNGVTKGGNGGSISNYHGQFDLSLIGNSAGVLSYVAGDGGTAVAGSGGNGGDVKNVSPFVFADGTNRMSGDVYLRGGEGGNGLAGGRGGDVAGFVNKASEQDSPAVLSFLGGSGGDATRGRGGRGGNVTDINSSSKGAPSLGTAPLVDGVPEQFSTRATVFSFNRVMAGDGGSSSGGIGGDGGAIANISSGNAGTAFAIVAGAGASGLSAGGNGGSVTNARVDVGGGSLGKALVIAGAGGDAGAFIANPNDPAPNQAEKAFGGKVGRGGDGGSIRNYTQLGGIGARADLIAGNGGDTVFYGRVGDQVNSVGKGGSISSVFVDGNLGNVSPTAPIKSYNDLKAGQSIADFVTANLRDRFAAGDIGDDVGNVGVIVGAAGRLKSVFSGFDNQNQPIYQSLPAFKGINGNLTEVTARSIMSAVAGSVERIAAIALARNVIVNASGEIGTDKAGLPDYRDKFGNAVSEPVPDGALVDGAMVVSKAPVTSSTAGNIFVIPT